MSQDSTVTTGNHTIREIRFEVHIEDVPTETFNRIVKGKDVHAFSVFDIRALVNVNEITKLHPQIVTGDFVHLNSALLNVI